MTTIPNIDCKLSSSSISSVSFHTKQKRRYLYHYYYSPLSFLSYISLLLILLHSNHIIMVHTFHITTTTYYSNHHNNINNHNNIIKNDHHRCICRHHTTTTNDQRRSITTTTQLGIGWLWGKGNSNENNNDENMSGGSTTTNNNNNPIPLVQSNDMTMSGIPVAGSSTSSNNGAAGLGSISNVMDSMERYKKGQTIGKMTLSFIQELSSLHVIGTSSNQNHHVQIIMDGQQRVIQTIIDPLYYTTTTTTANDSSKSSTISSSSATTTTSTTTILPPPHIQLSNDVTIAMKDAYTKSITLMNQMKTKFYIDLSTYNSGMNLLLSIPTKEAMPTTSAATILNNDKNSNNNNNKNNENNKKTSTTTNNIQQQLQLQQNYNKLYNELCSQTVEGISENNKIRIVYDLYQHPISIYIDENYFISTYTLVDDINDGITNAMNDAYTKSIKLMDDKILHKK